eukprot:6588446-Pyramimonas_sp.AAC.1
MRGGPVSSTRRRENKQREADRPSESGAQASLLCPVGPRTQTLHEPTRHKQANPTGRSTDHAPTKQ